MLAPADWHGVKRCPRNGKGPPLGGVGAAGLFQIAHRGLQGQVRATAVRIAQCGRRYLYDRGSTMGRLAHLFNGQEPLLERVIGPRLRRPRIFRLSALLISAEPIERKSADAVFPLPDGAPVMAWVARLLPPARRAPAESVTRDRELESLARVSAEFARTHDPEVVARTFLDEIGSLFRAEFTALTLVSEDGREAGGFLARSGRSDVDWWRDVRLDLERDPSGVASAAFEGTAFAVYDIEGSSRVSMRLAQNVEAKSAAFVPLVSGDHVIAVLSVATTSERRNFTAGDLDLMQTLATETAMALDRARSSIALQEALERERLLRTITRKLRSALDLDAVLDVAVSETGQALRADRCFVRLGEPGAPMPLVAEWNAEGVAPVGDLAEELPASNLALRERRTIAVSDILDEPALAEPALGRREALVELRARSVLSTPVTEMDEVIGVLALHRGT